VDARVLQVDRHGVAGGGRVGGAGPYLGSGAREGVEVGDHLGVEVADDEYPLAPERRQEGGPPGSRGELSEPLQLAGQAPTL
jgi:hypothetical protein